MGNQEGDLHKRLMLTLQMLCERSSGFADVSDRNAFLRGVPSTGYRYPDLAVIHDGRRIVFELQISKTYLPVISDRESFYRQNGIYLLWLFYDFDRWRDRQTERDIIAMRSRQAFELDTAAIQATLETGHLTLRAHWQVPALDGAIVNWRWESRLIAIDELVFDGYLGEAMAADPWRDEAFMLNAAHAPLIAKFEKYWIDRIEQASKLGRRLVEVYQTTGVIDKERTAEAVTLRALRKLFEASGTDANLTEHAIKLRLPELLDRLLFLRDGVNHTHRQTIAGAIDTVLERWPHFTDTIAAVAWAYGHRQIFQLRAVQRKIDRNLKGDGAKPVPQSHEFDRVAALLCPQAATWLRASPTNVPNRSL